MQENSKVSNSNFKHSSVLSEQIIGFIHHSPEEIRNTGCMLDATIGGGGHSAKVLETFPEIQIIGLDQDPIAINAAKNHLQIFHPRVKIYQTNFRDFQPLKKLSIILADLGVSSPQLDEPSRGFSFKEDGPIDMRMNNTKGIKACELISQLSEQELANIIYKYGEEKLSRRIARKIKNDLSTKGSYSGTLDLAYAISGCYPPKWRYGRTHPATKTFQALRIVINKELDCLESILKQGPDWLLPNGIFMVISFHSLEDRLVKNSFKKNKDLEIITKKPITANSNEVSKNPRSRSAKLRVARKKI